MEQILQNNIVKNGYKLSTGFIGTSLLLPVLSEPGMERLAYRLLLQEENPSWLYSVNQGATTIWERWDSYTKENGFHENGMNSFNHFSYGSVGQWMYEDLLGIQYIPAQSPDYQFVIAPQVLIDEKEGIGECQGFYDSPLGKIGMHWKNIDGGVVYQVEIPANTKGKVVLKKETLPDHMVKLREGRKSSLEELAHDGYIQNLKIENEEISFILTSGIYEFR